MYDVVAPVELLIDFTCQSTDASGYPTLSAHPGGISSIPPLHQVEALMRRI